MQKNPNPLQKLSIYLIVNVHQRKLSPYLNEKGSKCRFYPSCSNYGLMAIEKYGFFKGWVKTIWRIMRCVPSNCKSCVDYPWNNRRRNQNEATNGEEKNRRNREFDRCKLLESFYMDTCCIT